MIKVTERPWHWGRGRCLLWPECSSAEENIKWDDEEEPLNEDLNQYLLKKTIGKLLFQGHILWPSWEWPWRRVFSLWGQRCGATWGTLCSKSPEPDGVRPWVLNETKWEIGSSVTEIYNECFKTGNIPKDGEAVNMVLGLCVGRWGGYALFVCILCIAERDISFLFLFVKQDSRKIHWLNKKMGTGD